MTQSELRQKYVDILKAEVYPHNEEMIEYCISTCAYIVALSDERITVINHDRGWLGETAFFKEALEHLQDCLEGKRKVVARVLYITSPADSKLVREVIYIPGERPDWIRAENKRISKLTKEDIKALIAGYQTVIENINIEGRQNGEKRNTPEHKTEHRGSCERACKISRR